MNGARLATASLRALLQSNHSVTLLSSFSYAQIHDAGDRDRVLTDTDAHARAALVHNATYELDLKLTKGAPNYTGSVCVRFDVRADALSAARTSDSARAHSPVFIDYTGRTITALVVNGHDCASRAADEQWWHSERIHVPLDAIVDGANVIEISYVNFYDHGGDGFHQFVDPMDGCEYLYTNFEPFFAHRLLPCFDQPDIKARLTTTITAPSVWKVFANTAAVASAPAGGALTTHSFAPTEPISPYLFAVVAGPYESFADVYHRSAARGGGTIPLGVHCRRSLAQWLDHDEIFEITKQGFAFYEEFFDRDYAFGKYDQVFCPEYNVGAMENVGLVTFNEAYIFKDPPTLSRRAKRADTILHEMRCGVSLFRMFGRHGAVTFIVRASLAIACVAAATCGSATWSRARGGMVFG